MYPSKIASLFICYSFDQIDWTRKIGTEINTIFDGKINAWWDERKSTGDYWDNVIKEKLSEADAFLLILSSGFFKSDYIQNTELPIIIRRHESEKIRIIPIIATKINFERFNELWLNEIDVFPHRGLRTISEILSDEIDNWIKNLSIEPVWRRMEIEFRRISIRALGRPFQYDLRLPNGSGYIIERNEIEELENWNVKENDQKIAFLIGEAGSGKSSILYRYASRNVETGRILYVDAREHSNTKNYSDFIQVLEIFYEEENFFKQIEKLDFLTICIDSLDVVCWNPKTFNFFLQLIYRLYSFSNIRFVLACRIFDLKNNGDLLILKDQSKVFHLEKLPHEVTESILLKAGFSFPNKENEKNEILEFFSLPLYLKMLFMLNASEFSSLLNLSKETTLYERIWNDKVNGKNKHIDERSSPQERSIFCYRLSEQSLNQRQLDIPLSILKDSEGYTIDADEVLKSEGFIQGEFARGFFHQTVLDHVTVYRIRENGEDPYQFVKSYLNDFFSQPILRVYLSYLHLEIIPRIRKEYIQSIEKILIDKNILRIWKLNVIRFLAELSMPVQDEIDLLDRLLIPDSIFEIYFIQYFHPNWLPVLLNLKYTDRLLSSKGGMAHFRLLKALTKIAESNNELDYIVLLTKELFKHFQLNSARDIHLLLLWLKKEDQIKLFPQYVNYLSHSEAVKDEYVRILSKDHWELFQSVLTVFPDLVLNSILNAEFDFISHENKFEDLIQGILETNPSLIESILTHFVNLLVKEKKIYYNSISSEDDYITYSNSEDVIGDNNLELPYESDMVCVYYYDQKTFYPETTDQNQYWAKAIELSCILQAKKGSSEYPVLYRKLLNTPFETPVRIALLSALEYKNEKLYLNFYLNPNYFKLSSIGPILIQKLCYIRGRSSDTEWSSIENAIHLVGAYRSTQFSKDSASNFYLEVRTSLRDISVSRKMQRKFLWAEAIYKKRINNWNKENIDDPVIIPEVIELEAKPGGISDVVIAGAAFSKEDYLSKPLQERLQLLIDHGPGSKSDRSLGSWWVESGRVIEGLYLKDPFSLQEDLCRIAEQTELLPYRCFLIRAITTYIQKNFTTRSTHDENSKNRSVRASRAIEEMTKNVLLLTEKDRSDLGRDYSVPISDFLHFICVSYEILSPEIRKLIRDRFHNHLPNIVEIEEHLKSVKDEDRGWNALNTSVNTRMGKAIEAASIILYFEKEAPIELDLILRMSKSKEISNRVGVAARLLNLKNDYRQTAEQILQEWDQSKDLGALQFGIRYFQQYYYPSEIPSIFDYLSRWIQYVENEIVNDGNQKKLPRNSLSGGSVRSLLGFASSEEKARELLEYIFNQNVSAAYLLRITAVNYIFDHCLDPLTKYYSQLLERMSIDPVPAVRKSLIQRIWQSKDHVQESERKKIHNYPELVRKIFLNAIKIGNLSDDFLSHLISEHISQTWKASPEWAVEIFELIIIENKVVFYEHDLSNFAQTIKSIYLFEKELQARCSELLNHCIDKGWDGLDDLFGLGRG
ncbi:TIR domain-containing protein [Leptospira mayottensis]|uniref:TIR domain protein n=2 Tax=Leptospira mayottensis TaxID=1137606 RepID=A0AA87MMN9_9LEPT|nr:TIR domain-containing protein [Leptospira mayottensis]AXR66280.1 TIR domain-containing protein [Leptospira mayottensis]AXR66522.1 TIR domain-containing protein [Leptospira mayottensis]EKR98511.1 TIR domain protein [Leptospira mayottensis 200901122]